MTYRFLCKYFKPRVAGWITAFWFAVLIMAMYMLSSSEEDIFLYIDF